MVDCGNYNVARREKKKKQRSEKGKREKEKDKKIMLKKEKTSFYMIPSWKQKAPGLNSRKERISLSNSLFGFQDLYHEHSKRMCLLISIG